MTSRESAITRYLRSAPVATLTTYATIASFTAYFSMYAFRKPFSAGRFEGFQFFDSQVTLKTAFVVSQILGYALSKVIGIRFCSEVQRHQRLWALLGLVGLAELALLAFAVLPPNWKVVAMFFNGLPLGMIWGLVVLYLEGRRTSDILLAGLCCSFILSSGYVKTAGIMLKNWLDLTEFWMPFVTGLFFYPLFALSVWLLDQVPQPDSVDVEQRVERRTMTRTDRWAFFRQFAPGLTMLLITYFFLTAYRDYRDNFAAEVFKELGYGEQPEVFAQSETWVAFAVMAAMAGLNLIRSNRWGLFAAFLMMMGGTSLLAVGTLAFDRGAINGLQWMICVGTGAYLAYVPYNAVLFDRLIASTRAVGTAVFAINLADSAGYAGVISLLVAKDTLLTSMSRFEFLRYLSYFMAGLGTVLLLLSAIYLFTAHKHHD